MLLSDSNPAEHRYAPSPSCLVGAQPLQGLCNALDPHRARANWRCDFPPPDDYSHWHRLSALDVGFAGGLSPPPSENSEYVLGTGLGFDGLNRLGNAHRQNAAVMEGLTQEGVVGDPDHWRPSESAASALSGHGRWRFGPCRARAAHNSDRSDCPGAPDWQR